jgi:hypothetical protein
MTGLLRECGFWERVFLAHWQCRSLDKVRIIALYILFREGVADEDRRRLYQHARLSLSEQDAINNMIHLGIKVIKVSSVLVRDGQHDSSTRTIKTALRKVGSSRNSRQQKASTSCHGINRLYRWFWR